jgi:hypothetical protein
LPLAPTGRPTRVEAGFRIGVAVNTDTTVAETPWHVFGMSRCPRCGIQVPVVRLLRGGHECDPYDQRAHEAAQLEERLELLHLEVEEFLRSAEGRKRLAFARWCREHRGWGAA